MEEKKKRSINNLKIKAASTFWATVKPDPVMTHIKPSTKTMKKTALIFTENEETSKVWATEIERNCVVWDKQKTPVEIIIRSDLVFCNKQHVSICYNNSMEAEFIFHEV